MVLAQAPNLAAVSPVCQIIAQRISRLVQEDPEVAERLRLELNIAKECTEPVKHPLMAQSHKEMLYYRMIYSDPDLKEFIEAKLGSSIGRLPPVSKATLQVHFPKTSTKAIGGIVFGYMFLWTTYMLAVILGESIWVVSLAPICAALGYALYRYQTYWFEKAQSNSWCCECGQLATEAELPKACTNCRGTGVCKVGCKSCCPLVAQREEVEAKVRWQMVLEKDPALQSKVDKLLEDRVLDYANKYPEAEITPALTAELFMEILHEDPSLQQELEQLATRPIPMVSNSLPVAQDNAYAIPGRLYDLPSTETAYARVERDEEHGLL